MNWKIIARLKEGMINVDAEHWENYDRSQAEALLDRAIQFCQDMKHQLKEG